MQAVELAQLGGFIRVFVDLGPYMQTMLGISPATAKRHTVNLYGKLGVSKRWDAVVGGAARSHEATSRTAFPHLSKRKVRPALLTPRWRKKARNVAIGSRSCSEAGFLARR